MNRLNRLLTSSSLHKINHNINNIAKINALNCNRLFSSSGNGGDNNNDNNSNDAKNNTAPDNFYDEKNEHEKMLLDSLTAIRQSGSVEGVTRLKNASVRYNNVKDVYNDIPAENVEDLKEFQAINKERFTSKNKLSSKESADKVNLFLNSLSSDIKSSLLVERTPNDIDDLDLDEEYDPNDDDEVMTRLKENFLPPTSPYKYDEYTQGFRACPGKKQRRGKKGELWCHKIDLQKLSHYDVMTLRKYISPTAEILGRRDTGLCAKCQRKVAKTIKRARNFGFLPRIDTWTPVPLTPTDNISPFHDDIDGKRDSIDANTIMMKEK